MKKNTLSLVFSLFTFFSTVGQVTNLPIAFDEIRYLTELNGFNIGTGYPWISDDGLRIYFVLEPFGGSSSLILHAERPNLQASFTNMQTLPINIPDTYNISPWLTNDELTIYYSTLEFGGGVVSPLYRATRSSIDEDFGAPAIVELEGTPTLNFLASASFTADASQLYLFTSDGGSNKAILYYEQTDSNTYEYIETLQLPVGLEAAPCKLSRDGLSLYAGLTPVNGRNQLYVFKRDSQNEQFSNLFFLENNQLNPSSFYNRQPAVGCGGDCIAFTRGNADTFSANDLWLASREPTASQNIFRPAVEAAIYPNPAVNFIKFDFEVPEKYTGLRLLVFNANGQLVAESELPNTPNVFDLEVTGFHSGSYFYQLRGGELLLMAGKFLVK
ncbi:MAG: T9SS type A sorting domain-containing protein [Bacteroidota bacterium]